MKQIPFSKCSALLGIALLALLSSCEDPKLQTKEVEATPEPSVEEKKMAKEQPAPASEAPAAKPEPPKPEPKPEARPEPAYPELAVFLEGETLVIDGALRSRMQKARIAEEMAAAFPHWKVDDRLQQETHRHAVGWGNRVSMGFLIPYFEEIADPYVGFEEGVVVLKGTVGERRQIKFFQELAISVFAGAYLQDIRNEMKVATE
ncbi:MAG: hypothetical protein AAGF67_00565 [Verrucomicrobiota bacterium]